MQLAAAAPGVLDVWCSCVVRSVSLNSIRVRVLLKRALYDNDDEVSAATCICARSGAVLAMLHIVQVNELGLPCRQVHCGFRKTALHCWKGSCTPQHNCPCFFSAALFRRSVTAPCCT